MSFSIISFSKLNITSSHLFKSSYLRPLTRISISQKSTFIRGVTTRHFSNMIWNIKNKNIKFSSVRVNNFKKNLKS